MVSISLLSVCVVQPVMDKGTVEQKELLYYTSFEIVQIHLNFQNAFLQMCYQFMPK